MKITRKSHFSGIVRTKEFNVTEEQLELHLQGMLIQNAMPYLTADEREFILTGITQEEWNEMFGDEKA